MTTLERSTGWCGASRPASARASSSRSATSRRIRREERSAEAAASRCSPSSVLLEQLEVGEHRRQRRAQLVRGVGDELALAVQRRLRLAARVVERREHRLQRAGQLGDLVLGLGPRDRRAGSRERSTWRAAAVSSAIGSIARRAVARPASRASSGAAEHAEARNTFTRLAVASTSDSRRAYCTIARRPPESLPIADPGASRCASRCSPFAGSAAPKSGALAELA